MDDSQTNAADESKSNVSSVISSQATDLTKPSQSLISTNKDTQFILISPISSSDNPTDSSSSSLKLRHFCPMHGQLTLPTTKASLTVLPEHSEEKPTEPPPDKPQSSPPPQNKCQHLHVEQTSEIISASSICSTDSRDDNQLGLFATNPLRWANYLEQESASILLNMVVCSVSILTFSPYLMSTMLRSLFYHRKYALTVEMLTIIRFKWLSYSCVLLYPIGLLFIDVDLRCAVKAILKLN